MAGSVLWYLTYIFYTSVINAVIPGNLQGPRKKANLPNSAPVVDLEDVIIGEDLRIAMLKVCTYVIKRILIMCCFVIGCGRAEET